MRGVSFSVAKGDIVGLLGPNGAGKTTTMRMLTTFLPPSGGTAQVGGYDIRKDPDGVRQSIGYLPETPPLYNEMRVADYLRFVGKIRDIDGAKLKERVEAAIERCGLRENAKRVCGALSKGYRQRVGIAQAIIHDPKVVILDEPTSGLDPVQLVEVRTLLTEMAKDRTVVMSTHILGEVKEVCNRAIVIAEGKKALDRRLDELSHGSSLEEEFIQAVAGTTPVRKEGGSTQ